MIYNITSYLICLLGILGCIACNNTRGNVNNALHSSKKVDLTPLDNSLEFVKVFGTKIFLVDSNRIMQSFGFDKKDNIYFSQISGSGKDKDGSSIGNDLIYIARSKNGEEIGDDFMTLKYFGHGANIVVEESKETPYVWISSNASKHITGDKSEAGNYWSERSISRIKYEKGKVYEGFGGETYFLNRGDFYVQLAAIDEHAQYFCIVASTKDSNKLTRNFFTFNLEEVKMAPLKEFTFKVRIGGETKENPERIVNRVVKGYDLGKIKPLGTFSFLSGKNWNTDISSYPNQGIEIDSKGRIYFYEGVHAGKSRPQGAYVSVFNIQGDIIGERTAVNAVFDTSALFKKGLTDVSGNMEAEGIKIIGNRMFLGFGSRFPSENSKKSLASATIFEYHMNN